MNRIASKSWLDAIILRQLIAETLSDNNLIWRPQSQLSPSRFNGGDCKVTQVIYDTLLVSLNIYIVCLKYKLADVSAGKLSTPETWAHDTGSATPSEAIV